MNKKLLLILAGVMTTLALGLGVAWWLSGDSSTGHRNDARQSRSTLQETGTIDLFGLVLPGRQSADGNTAIVRADLQIVVPLKYRLEVEHQTSKIREIIATILRNSDVPEINRDDLVGFRQQIVTEVRRQLGIEISEILVLRFSYDIVPMHVPR